MSKSIYEEALDDLMSLLDDEFGYNLNNPKLTVSQRLDIFKIVNNTLKQAQKQEKLLELYKELSMYVDKETWHILVLKIKIKEIENERN